MEQIKISIIVPVYNVEKYLSRCIKSLMNQTYENLEFIMVDDGSTDRSSEICDEYKNADDRITVIHKKNSGLSDARNTGFARATGDYVLFIDSDDYIIENACEIFVKKVTLLGFPDIIVGQLVNPDGSIYCNGYSKEYDVIYLGTEYLKKFSSKISPCVIASAYKRTFISDNYLSFKSGRLHEDSEFTPRAYALAKTVAYINNPFYVKTVNENSITTSKDKRRHLLSCKDNAWDLYWFSKSIDDRKAARVVKDKACNSYLGMFLKANIYQYEMDYKQYIDRSIVIKTASSLKNRCKTLLFLISPRLFIKIGKIFTKA